MKLSGKYDFKGRDLHKYFQSLSPARISQKKNNFNETNFERGRNRKMPNRKSQQSQSAPDNGKIQLCKVMSRVRLDSSNAWARLTEEVP